MTSKISFSNLVRSEMKKLNWLMAVQALVFGLLMPFKVLMVLTIRANEEAQYHYGWDLQKIFGEVAGFGQAENTLFILGAGVLCALAAFSYLYSSAKLDFYHSLAIRRETLFSVKVVSSSLTFIIPYVICQMLTILTGIFYKAVNATVLTEILVDILAGILYFLCSYSGALLAIMLTGKMVTTFFALITLAAYIPILYILYIGMEALFMPNRLESMDYLQDTVFACSSPWAFCLYGNEAAGGMRMGLTGYWPSLAHLCQVAAVAVILFLISVFLYKKRKTEIVGNALAFCRTEGIVKILLTVAAALGAAMVACETLEHVVWEIVFMILFGGLACVIMEFIYRADIRQALSHKIHIVATVVLATGIFLFVKYDMTGYNSYVPEKNEIQSMAILDNYSRIQYDLGNGYPAAYQYALQPEMLDYFETEEFDGIYEIAKEGASYDLNRINYEDVLRIGIKYKLKNGKEIYRAYWGNREKYFAVMDELLEDQQYKEKLFPIMTWDEEMVKTMAASIWLPESQIYQLYEMTEKWSGENSSAAGESEKNSDENSDIYMEDTMKEIDLSFASETIASDNLWKVVKAYRKDLNNLNTMDYRNILESYGELNFQWDERNQCYYGNYPLSIEFENTMEVLAEIFAS